MIGRSLNWPWVFKDLLILLQICSTSGRNFNELHVYFPFPIQYTTFQNVIKAREFATISSINS